MSAVPCATLLWRASGTEEFDDMSEGSETPKAPVWKPAQTYTLAVICLIIGLAIGYFLRGSASPGESAATQNPGLPARANVAPAAAENPHAGMSPQQQMPSLDDMKKMADKQAAPLLAKLKTEPNNADLLNQLGVMYRATHQFKTAIDYYQKALAINPKNVGARTDMASCMYYLGDVDGALAQLNKSLSYDPKHMGTLINIGIIKWKGKDDVNGAIAAWQQALKLSSDPKDKEVLEHMIAEAKQQQQNKPPNMAGVKG
jgi:cytochrome c-type biogenesis protein CcmH/NrfG